MMEPSGTCKQQARSAGAKPMAARSQFASRSGRETRRRPCASYFETLSKALGPDALVAGPDAV